MYNSDNYWFIEFQSFKSIIHLYLILFTVQKDIILNYSLIWFVLSQRNTASLKMNKFRLISSASSIKISKYIR